MKTRKSPLYLSLLILLVVGMACSITGTAPPTETDAPISAPPEKVVEPTAAVPTAEEPTAEVTAEVPNRGQIVYSYQGNLWRYIVDTGAITQITMDGVADSYEMSYGYPLISPDGSLLAFDRGTSSFIHDFASTSMFSFADGRKILQWVGDAREYVFYRGNLTCPAVENLEDQVLLNFDLVRVNFDTPSTEIFIRNIAGGLKFPQNVSENGQWAGVMYCGCYSECGSNNLLNLTTGLAYNPPMTLYAGELAFSPDSLFIVTAQQQVYGYYQSPLYIANVDYTGMTSIFSEPNSAPLWYRWSPDGQWIAMTLIYFDSDGMTITDSRVVLLKPNGSSVTIVDGPTASFVDWSPDGTQLLYSKAAGGSSTLHIYDLASGVKTTLPMTVSGSMYLEADWGRLP
jgi:hypothetical protein